MSLVRRAFAHQRITNNNAALVLLRAQHAPVILAILEQRFTGEQRQIPAPEFFEQVTEDLQELRSEGFDLPRTAQDYVADWRRAEILIRRPSTESREETFELSPGAIAAMQFVDELHEPRRTVTESRLATIQNMLVQLVAETDPDVTSRLATLEAEKPGWKTRFNAWPRATSMCWTPNAPPSGSRRFLTWSPRCPPILPASAKKSKG